MGTKKNSITEELIKKYEIETINRPEKQFILEKNKEYSNSSFCIYDYAKVYRQVEQFKKEHTNVKGYFEVRANNDPALLEILSNLGFGFKCVSLHEVKWVRQVSDSSIIFWCPLISSDEMMQLTDYAIDYILIDSCDQMLQVKKYLPNCKILLYSLSEEHDDRFGVNFHQGAHLLKLATDLKLKVVGIYLSIKTNEFLEDAKLIISGFLEIFELRNHNFDVLLSNQESLTHLDKFTCLNSIICGAFITSSELITSMNVDEKSKEIKYYCQIGELFTGHHFEFFEEKIPSEEFNSKEKANEQKYKCTFFGPTCDSCDWMVKNVEFEKLELNDHVVFNNLGSSTIVYSGSLFNGFREKHHVFRIFNIA